jgi:hypothetical protein
VTNNTNLYVKLVFTGTQYILSYSTDGGISYIPDITVASSLNISIPIATGLIRLGQVQNIPTANLYKGIIDLAKSSIKINGGRNLLTPEPGVFLNRIIYDTQDGGVHYKQHYSQVSV